MLTEITLSAFETQIKIMMKTRSEEIILKPQDIDYLIVGFSLSVQGLPQ